jgi:spore coat protein A
VQWENRLSGRLPVIDIRSPAHEAEGVPVQCMPGRSGGAPNPDAAAISGYAVVHLHGAVTQATSDGWTENLIAPGQQALDIYENDQRAALLWYHDHVMGVTRFNLFAGLAGLWIVREARERELKLPEGPPYEVPLLLADRNFDTAADGSLTGELLHKTDPDVMECFSPFTTVNGVIWPRVDVERTTYRFRVLNGSNARTYRLVLTRDGQPDHERITQIGSDGGLLVGPVSIPAQGLVLASAERADILIDFSDLPVGSELTLWNSASAPFNGAFADPSGAGTPDLEGLLPYPEVLLFRVVDGRRAGWRPPAVLATDFKRADREQLKGCVVRAIALVEQESSGPGPSMLTMRELAEVAEADEPVLTLVEAVAGQEDHVSRWRTVATRFEDKTNFFPMLRTPEIWRLINLTGDTHPIHVHLESFQVLSRQGAAVEVPEGGITDTATSARVWIGREVDDGVPHALDENELGLKDTVRVNPNEVVDLVVRFDAYAGRYMYHCHILEHEDHDMMRPFVVMPPELMPFM